MISIIIYEHERERKSFEINREPGIQNQQNKVCTITLASSVCESPYKTWLCLVGDSLIIHVRGTYTQWKLFIVFLDANWWK